jgi:hypothetical protein
MLGMNCTSHKHAGGLRVALVLSACVVAVAARGAFRVAPFEADITIPIGHACMGGGVADAKEIVDPLFAKGFVLLGAGEPVVVVALDWCQCNNDSYDRWREALAEAAGTSLKRVMLATVHQHLLYRLRRRYDGRQIQHRRAGQSSGARAASLRRDGGGVAEDAPPTAQAGRVSRG